MRANPRRFTVSRAPLALALALALTVSIPLAPASAQGSFVVPSKALTTAPGATANDASIQSYTFWGTTGTSQWARVQYLYDVTDIPIPGGFLMALAVRAPHNSAQTAQTFTTNILVSNGPNAPNSASTNFANNHGVNVVTVHSGPVNLPATASGTWPSPWQPAIPFAQPVTYASAIGPSLVVDFETTAAGTRSWSLEGWQADAGNTRSEFYQSNCKHSGNAPSGGWSWTSTGMVVGGSLLWYLNGYPNNTPSLAVNAAFFGFTGVGSQVGPFTTPFLLSNLGLPSQPNCQFAIGFVDGWPMSYVSGTTTPNSSTLRLPNVPIPNVPAVGGLNLYGQNVALDTDPSSGQTLLFPSIAVRFTIGTGAAVPVSRVLALGSAPVATGSVTRSNGASLRVDY